MAPSPLKVAAIVPAAGRGLRLGSPTPKPFVPVNGKLLLEHTLTNLLKAYRFVEVVLAVGPAHLQAADRLIRRMGLRGRVRAVAGGRTRAESVRNALWTVAGDCDWVLVHDAVRPLVTRRLVRDILKAAEKTGAALCALPATATVKEADPRSGIVRGTRDRRSLFLAQTPQVFRKSLLFERYRKLGEAALAATDEAALFDGTRVKVRVVLGEPENLKVTVPGDIALFKFYLSR